MTHDDQIFVGETVCWFSSDCTILSSESTMRVGFSYSLPTAVGVSVSADVEEEIALAETETTAKTDLRQSKRRIST